MNIFFGQQFKTIKDNYLIYHWVIYNFVIYWVIESLSFYFWSTI